MPTQCPSCEAPKYRLFRWNKPTKEGQRWLCAACDHIWIPQPQKKD